MSCAGMDALILLSLVMMWLDEATDPFHTAPGAFHTKLEFHVNGCGMEMCFSGNAPFLAMVFFGEDGSRREKWRQRRRSASRCTHTCPASSTTPLSASCQPFGQHSIFPRLLTSAPVTSISGAGNPMMLRAVHASRNEQAAEIVFSPIALREKRDHFLHL